MSLKRKGNQVPEKDNHNELSDASSVQSAVNDLGDYFACPEYRSIGEDEDD